MRGPKPCPFSLFDTTGVTGYPDALYPNQKIPIYASTNNANWNGKNVDGISFPNTDSKSSCSAALPLVLSNVLNPDLNTISIGTVNALNPVLSKVYVRPTHAWAPHYEEDTSFQACAPQASPVHDPPLHFSKDLTSGNVAWCAEDYPSQNDHIPALDILYNGSAPPSGTNTYVGHVRPFTSHIAKNSASADCTATIPSSIPAPISGFVVYPNPSNQTPNSCVAPNPAPAGIAWHPTDMLIDTKNSFPGGVATPINVCANMTCDRTAIIAGGLSWPHFPLLSTAPQVEAAISADSTYGCVMTYDGGGPKAGKLTPIGGCCGANVTLNTGFKPITGATAAGLFNTNAHLEPDVPCLIPSY